MDDIETVTSILRAELGDVQKTEEVCPGVYYAAVSDDQLGSLFAREYYVAWNRASMITAKAKAYGQELSSAPEYLLYPWNKDDSGWRIVKYESNLYLHKKGKLPDGEREVRDNIAFGREFHPDYFGCYPLPAAIDGSRLIALFPEAGTDYLHIEKAMEFGKTDEQGA